MASFDFEIDAILLHKTIKKTAANGNCTELH